MPDFPETTRIADLPMGGGGGNDNIRYELMGGGGMGMGGGGMGMGAEGGGGAPPMMKYSMPTMPSSPAANVMVPGGNTYIPLNIHPNPFGNTAPTSAADDLRFPTATAPERRGDRDRTSLDDLQMVPEMPQRLPSRDIPRETILYSTDEEIQANYVPGGDEGASANVGVARRKRDCLRDYDAEEAGRMREHRKTRNQRTWTDDVWENLELPVLVAILYFISHMRVVDRTLQYVLGSPWLRGIFYREDDGMGRWSTYGVAMKSVLFGGAVIAGTIGTYGSSKTSLGKNPARSAGLLG